jgi:hypothetical protein
VIVPWLNQDCVLKRVYELKSEIELFVERLETPFPENFDR